MPHIGRVVEPPIPSACGSGRGDSCIAERFCCTCASGSCSPSFPGPGSDLLIQFQVVFTFPSAQTSTYRGSTVHPALLHCLSSELYRTTTSNNITGPLSDWVRWVPVIMMTLCSQGAGASTGARAAFGVHVYWAQAWELLLLSSTTFT
jgi:hypothetical protein